MRSFIKLCLLAVAVLVLTACQSSVTAAPEATATPSTLPGLAGTNWVLSSLEGDLPLPGTTVTLQFGADGALSGNDGCNQFSTTYVQDGNQLTIVQPGASTLMACQADVMQQATNFMDALAVVTSFSANNRQLILQADGQVLATFRVDSQELAGTSWEVTAYNNGRDAVVSLLIGTEISAEFGEDGLVSGNAGCNDYFAEFSSGNGEITVSPPGSTFRFCPEPSGVMEQEAEYLAALESATTYSIQGNSLQMRRADDQLALTMTRRYVVDLPAPPDSSIAWGRAIAPRGLNVRSGPGVNFPVIGVAVYGDQSEIVGRSEDGAWWAVPLPSTAGGIGWVSTDFVIALNTADVPVLEVAAPPIVIPTVEVPASTPTPMPPPTATPTAQISFTADHTTIEQGQCTTLRWSAQNVEVVWINPQNDLFDRTPRPHIGIQQVCPAVTTTYEMRSQLRDGTFDLQTVTVTVTPSQQPQISLWADRTTIDQGQCTRLYWSVENVQGVWVYPQGESYQRFPRVGNDSERVCPDRTTTYEMRVLLQDGSTVFREVTINVNPAPTSVPPTATPVPPTATPVANPLADTRWDVINYNNGQGGVITMILDTHANLNFAGDSTLSGNASCNNFTASYQVNGNGINIGLAGSAQAFCPEPEGIMDQESQILAAMQSATSFAINGNILEFRTGGDQIALLLQRAP